METTFPCPYCKEPVLGRRVNRNWMRKSFCDACHAPIRFRALSDFVGYVVGLCVAGGVAAGISALGFLDKRPDGSLDRGSVANLIVFLLLLIVWGVVQEYVHARTGSLVLASRSWPLRLTQAERKLMRAHDIRHTGEYFACGEMHFDRLEDAVAYSQQAGSRT
jgi:hypothetical protein